MSENQPNWINWARTLKHWGMNNTAAYLLETAGSLNVLFAQLVYICQPMLASMVSSISLETLARVLENPADRQVFIGILREGVSRDTTP